MASTAAASGIDNTSPSTARVAPTTNNFNSYPSFDIRLVVGYINKQLCYYIMTEAIYNVNKAMLKIQLKKYNTLFKQLN